MSTLRPRELSPPWVALVGLVMLVGIAAVAFVDYEMIRADADAAQAAAGNARASCLYGGGRASTPAERKQRHARCGNLPAPLRERERVQSRWDRRGPWYAVAAVGILIPTAIIFVRSRRRYAASATVDPPSGRPWRIATIAVRCATGIMTWGALAYLVLDRWWERFVEATGGSTHDCHYAENDCGLLGEFAEAHPQILLSLIVAAAAIPAAAIVWSFSRLFESLDKQAAESPAAPGPPA